FERGAREHLQAGADGLPQVGGGTVGVHSRLQPNRAEIDDVEATLRKEPGKIGRARQHHPKTHEPRAQRILAADRNLAVADFDDAAGVERPEHWTGGAVYEYRVGAMERIRLPVDAGGAENLARRVKADHKDIGPQGPLATLPFRKTEIDRRSP